MDRPLAGQGEARHDQRHTCVKNYDDDSLELYDLRRDVGENHNLAGQSPELAKRLAYKLDQWLRETGARMPLKQPAK